MRPSSMRPLKDHFSLIKSKVNDIKHPEYFLSKILDYLSNNSDFIHQVFGPKIQKSFIQNILNLGHFKVNLDLNSEFSQFVSANENSILSVLNSVTGTLSSVASLSSPTKNAAEKEAADQLKLNILYNLIDEIVKFTVELKQLLAEKSHNFRHFSDNEMANFKQPITAILSEPNIFKLWLHAEKSSILNLLQPEIQKIVKNDVEAIDLKDVARNFIAVLGNFIEMYSNVVPAIDLGNSKDPPQLKFYEVQISLVSEFLSSLEILPPSENFNQIISADMILKILYQWSENLFYIQLDESGQLIDSLVRNFETFKNARLLEIEDEFRLILTDLVENFKSQYNFGKNQVENEIFASTDEISPPMAIFLDRLNQNFSRILSRNQPLKPVLIACLAKILDHLIFDKIFLHQKMSKAGFGNLKQDINFGLKSFFTDSAVELVKIDQTFAFLDGKFADRLSEKEKVILRDIFA